jgi:hypothetical protein
MMSFLEKLAHEHAIMNLTFPVLPPKLFIIKKLLILPQGQAETILNLRRKEKSFLISRTNNTTK